MLEVFRDEFDKMLVIEVPGGAYDEIAGSEVVTIKAGDHGALEFSYGFARAQDRQPERVVLPEALGENLMD